MNLYEHIENLITSIEKGDYDTLHMSKKIDAAIAEVHETTFKYHARSVHPDLLQHLKTYTSYGKKNKYKLIATLENIQCEMNSKKPNNKVMLAHLNKILVTNFFADSLQKQMMLDTLISKKAEFTKEMVVVN